MNGHVTCNVLSHRGVLPLDCADSHEKCNYWSSVGECENNPNWMLKNCEVSCNSCQGNKIVILSVNLAIDSSPDYCKK